MITNLIELQQYLQSLATQHVALKDFVYGGSERILNRERSNIAYPVLWMELPDVRLRMGNGGWMQDFNFAFLCLAQAPPDDWAQEDSNMNAMLQVCLDILTRMHQDAEEEDLFHFDLAAADLLPKPSYSADSDHGYRVEVTVSIPISNCVNENNWTNA